MATKAKDPYYKARDQLQDAMNKTSSNFDSWKKILETQNTASSAEFAELSKSVQLSLKSLNVDIKNLQQVISVVENNRQVFTHIDDDDLNARRKFVNDITAQIGQIDDFMNSARTRKKIENDKRLDLVSVGGMAGRNADRSLRTHGDEVIDRKRQDQSARETEEKVVLEDMSSALDRLKVVSVKINTDIKEEGDMLRNMGDTMDTTQSMMNKSLRQMDVLLSKSKAGRLCCMFFLFLVAVLLLFLIVYGV